MEPFAIGPVFRRSFQVAKRNLLAFLSLGVLAHSPTLIFSAQPAVDLEAPGTEIQLLTLVLSMMLLAAVAYGSVLDLKGHRAAFFKCLHIAFRRLLAISALGILLGFIPLLITYKPALVTPLLLPWILITTLLYAAVPVLVTEHQSVAASLRLSAFLTRGRRWQIFAILLALGAGRILLDGLLNRALPGDSEALIILSQLSFELVVEVFAAIVAGVTYFELRRTLPFFP